MFGNNRIGPEKLTPLLGCEIKDTWQIVKIKMLICQLKANVDVKFCMASSFKTRYQEKILARGL